MYEGDTFILESRPNNSNLNENQNKSDTSYSMWTIVIRTDLQVEKSQMTVVLYTDTALLKHSNKQMQQITDLHSWKATGQTQKE